jgi:sugar transferase EpsL
MSSKRIQLYPQFVKPAFDRGAAAIALVLFAPILIAIAVLVRLKLGTPILFRQVRPGRDGQPFHLCKFRTMTDARDRAGQLLDDERRLTRFGKWLRSTSLDELPELWNVLRGDMSLVGPRPLLTQYLPLYTPNQFRRHLVKPGLTGLAQVSGRNAISWEQKFDCDLQYVDELSIRLDIKILIETVVRVVRRDGINAGEQSTMPAFMGTSRAEETKSSIAA